MDHTKHEDKVCEACGQVKERNRINLHDSVRDFFVKLSEGNPGALTVLLELFRREPTIDPDSAFPQIGTLLAFDDLGIYGSKIWICYKDVCGSDIVKLIALFRARQLGLISSYEIERAIEMAGAKGERTIDLDVLLARVKARLPRFAGDGRTSDGDQSDSNGGS
jgi:hypothetical protein